MNPLLTYIIAHAHGAIIHFPIALLLLSVLLDLFARNSAFLRRAAWLSLVLGTLATVPATITGLLAHLPYEASPKLSLIERHQYLAFATTAAFAVLTAWRWHMRRRDRDVGGTLQYSALSLLAIMLLALTWYNGANLVHVHGIGVQGVAP